MVDFHKKTIGPKDAFGAIFRRRREEIGVSLGTAAKHTGVPRHYLTALEEGHYSTLPGLVYGKSFVRVYGAFLRLSVAPLLRAFVDEYTLVRVTQSQRVKEEKKSYGFTAPAVRITPFRVRMALASALLLVLGIYFGGEVLRFVRPPYLSVESPQDQTMTTAKAVRVAGNVETGAAVTVNDVVVSNDAGSFTAMIALEEGINTLRVRAFRRHGKDTTVVRSVIRNGNGVSLK